MGISRVRIENFKTIDRMKIDFSDIGISCLLGKNGVGKTTIIEAIAYLYKMADCPYEINKVMDKKNPYVQRTMIEVVFDFKKLNKKNSNKYIEDNLSNYRKYIKDDKLPLRLIQHKKGLIEWYPINDVYKVRKLLRIFPIYFVDTRNISLYKWSKLWEIACDIAISGIDNNSEAVKSNLTDTFSEIYGEKYTKVYNILQNIFDEEKITINVKDYKSRFKNDVIANLGGEKFKVNEENISYYSAGMNSLKYITLLLKLVNRLSDTAWKDISVFLDEPEISLHPQFIEELADIMTVYGKKCAMIVSTHSTHLVSSLIRNYANISFYQVYSNNGYAKIKKMTDFFDEKNKYLIGDEEATTYFSDAIVFVEGQTEIQVLRNKNIVELFPILKKITIYNTKSNDSATRLIIPERGRSIPFLNIVDMDKILTYSDADNKFDTSNGNITVNPLGNKQIEEYEKFLYYSNRKKLTYVQRKVINTYFQDKYISDSHKLVIVGNKYNTLISSVKKYCKQYSCLPLRTTIEGAIICSQSLNIFFEWLKKSYMKDQYVQLMKDISKYDKKNQEAIIRCIFHGKLDNLFNYKRKDGNQVDPQICKIIDTYTKGRKVDGWVLSFFNWYFINYDTGSEIKNRKNFSVTFPELNEILQYLTNML